MFKSMADVVPALSGLSPAQFQALADVPPELEWRGNIVNEKTRRAYQNDVAEFSRFAGVRSPVEMRTVTRAHIIAWRKDMEARQLADSSIRRKLSALSSLFDYLCERNAVAGNPVNGVKRPVSHAGEGTTPALGDRQARALLEAPAEDTLKGIRDRAILATLLYHGIRREELCRLRVKDLESRQGVRHLRIHGKRDKIRFVPVHPAALRLIEQYLALADHGADLAGPLFRPIKNNRSAEKLERGLDPGSVYRNVVRHYAEAAGISGEVSGLCVHSLRATDSSMPTLLHRSGGLRQSAVEAPSSWSRRCEK